MIHDPLYNDPLLLRKFIEGDQPAFEIVFNEHYARLVFFVQKLSMSREEAEDIVTESFTKLWGIRQNFDSLPKIKSFLYTASRNGAIDRMRRSAKTVLLPLEDDRQESAGDLETVHAEVIGSIFREIENLPDKCGEVMLLTYRDGLSSREIADKLKISVSNVTSQRSRAITLLKIALLNKYPMLAGILLPELLKKLLAE